MPKPQTVTMLQCAMCLGTTLIGVGGLAVPRIMVEYTGTGAPFATFIAIAMMLVCGLILSYLGSQYPDKTIFEYTEQLVGKWLGRVLLIGISVYFLELAALTAREFGEVVVTSVLQRTPLEVTALIMILLAASAARNNIAVITRIQTFYMPFVYFPAIVIILLTLKSAHWTNILPIFAISHETTFLSMVIATFFVASLFQNYMIIGLLTPYMYRPAQAWKSALIGIGLAGLVYISVVYSTLSVFGTEEMKNLLWPTLELAKTAALPLLFVERMDPVFLAVWVTAVFTAILASYKISIRGFAHLLGFQKHKVLSTLGVPIIYLLAMQPPNIVVVYRIVQQVGISGLTLTVGYPLLLFILHFVRKTRQRQKDLIRTS